MKTFLPSFLIISQIILFVFNVFIGEVFLRRLSWSKVWKLPKRGDGIKITAIVWRPDSVVLAVGYSSGHVVLVDVESGEVVHTFNPCGEPITALSWENCSTSLKEEIGT